MLSRRTVRTCCVLGVALLGGCSIGSWKKPGASPQDFRSDYAACKADAAFIGPLVRPLRLENCMTARGYEVDRANCRAQIAGMPVQCRWQ